MAVLAAKKDLSKIGVIRLAIRLPQTLAAEAGIDTAEVLEIEHDPHCEPEPDAIYKLAAVFSVPPRKLMEVAGLVECRTSTLHEQAVRASPPARNRFPRLRKPRKKHSKPS